MRPSARLVAGLSLCALLAVATAGSTWLMGPAWSCLVLMLALAALDWRRTRREPPVEVSFASPPRCRLRERFTVTYVLRNPTARRQAVRECVL